MEKKPIALVTGGNRGIGLEVCRQLGRAGFRVILTARNQQAGEEAANALKGEGLSVDFHPLDITDAGSIAAIVLFLKQGPGSIDVLIHNAGILRREDRNILTTTDELLEETLTTNALAPLRLTQALAPFLPVGGRVIMVSSGGGSMTDPVGGWAPAYCISKTLLNGITRHLAYALSGQGITVNAACPGWVRTAMGGHSAPRSVAQGADTICWLATAMGLPSGKFFRDRQVIPW